MKNGGKNSDSLNLQRNMDHSQFTTSAIFCLTEFEERLHFRGRLAAYGLNFKLRCTAVARECKAMDNSIIWTWKLEIPPANLSC